LAYDDISQDMYACALGSIYCARAQR